MAHSSMLTRTAIKTRKDAAARHSQHNMEVYSKALELKEEKEYARLSEFMNHNQEKEKKLQKFEKRKKQDLQYKIEDEKMKNE